MKTHPSPQPSPLRGEREKPDSVSAAESCHTLREIEASQKSPSTPAAQIPSPLGGERVRVRGARRTRTAEARDFSRRLRKNSTDAEKRLWRLLRHRRFNDFKFRRQYPCGIYFLDFFCVEARLSVELDGGGHGFPGQRQHDEERERFLAAQGIKTLRFWNHQLRGELEAIRFEIWHALMERTGRRAEIAGFLPKPHPSPQPSPLGGERETRRSGATGNARAVARVADSLSPQRGEGHGEGGSTKFQIGISPAVQRKPPLPS